MIPLAELRTELEPGYRNSYFCAGILEQHTNGRITAKYCNNRWCFVCNRVRTARAILSYEPILLGWHQPQFVTLTLPTVSSDVLPHQIDMLIKEPARIARGLRRTDRIRFKALRKLECTYNPRTGLYHPHLHLIVDGPHAAARLLERWLSDHAEASRGAQDVRPADPRQLRELFKYFTKFTSSSKTGDKQRVPLTALDTIFRAMRRRRVYQLLGFTRIADTLDEDAPVGVDEATYAWSRIGTYIRWEWSQDLHDWLDYSTGEVLAGWHP